VVRLPSYGRSGTRATGYGRIAANEFADMIRPYGCPYGCVVRSPSYGRSGTRANSDA